MIDSNPSTLKRLIRKSFGFNLWIQMIRECNEEDFKTIFDIINDAAKAYRGVIPQDCWHEPYMSAAALRHEIDDGVVFWGYEKDEHLIGVMGIQDRGDVTLIRHAYVRTDFRKKGIGTMLLQFLEGLTKRTILVGTWADSSWATSFYEKNGYKLLLEEEKNRLLNKYWSIPQRQVETSVVLMKEKEKGFSNVETYRNSRLQCRGGGSLL